MVGQTAEWLSADDILHARLCKRSHFRRNEPALAHDYALIYILVGKPSQMLKIVERLKAALLLHYVYELLLLCVDELIAYLIENRALCGMIVYLCVVEVCNSAVHDEFQK